MEMDVKEIFIFYKSKYFSLDVNFNIKVQDLKEKIRIFTFLNPNNQKLGVVSDKNLTEGEQKFFIIPDDNNYETLYNIGLMSGDRIYVVDKNLFN
ncbi:hypothetical protein QJ854_gp773 [Moumouvirus goulette]|uniref:Ubiquitin-like domain-containing protein n=1 Tax=Moumouvirus goulette TaxID=1247379 RepID=M1PAX6_9VIRU|nr:hypothetical protein QJ854_gp773 [Moumouvirus goulette]AGF85009.1 hypothetical protein glt_00200 [Moumouvirus goulette]